jgi:methionyl-tRNA formyltransferase
MFDKLAEGGAGLLVATLDGIADGSLEAREQPADGVTYAPKITVEDAQVDWTHPAVALDRQIRACTPAPGAWTTLPDGSGEPERIKLGPVTLTEERIDPGVIEVRKNDVLVGTATTAVRLGQVKAFGKREMAAADWARGVRLESGARFGC